MGEGDVERPGRNILRLFVDKEEKFLVNMSGFDSAAKRSIILREK